MKKAFISTVVLLLIINFCKAQSKLEAGIKIGIQSSKFWTGSFLDITTSKYKRVSPSFDIYSKYHLNKNFFIEYDLGLSFEGGGFEKRKTKLSVLKNSIFIGASTSTLKKNSFNLKIGYNLNALLKSEMVDSYTGTTTDVSNYLNNTYNSFPIGLGYSRKVNESLRIGFNALFQMFASPINPEEHFTYAQTFSRFDITVSKFLNQKNE